MKSLVLIIPWWLRWWRIHLQSGKPGFNPWVGKIPWRRAWQPISVFLPGEFHGQRSLVGYSPWGCKESDKTDSLRITQHTILDKKQSSTEDRLCTTQKNFSAFLCPLRHFAEYPLENNLNPHLAPNTGALQHRGHLSKWNAGYKEIIIYFYS